MRCPVLILQGGRDVQVSAERDAPKLVAALDAAKHPDHELKLFPTLDHARIVSVSASASRNRLRISRAMASIECPP